MHVFAQALSPIHPSTPQQTRHDVPNTHRGHSQATIMQEKDLREDDAAM